MNFVYKPGHVHSTPDALSQIPALNVVGKLQSLLEAVRFAQKISTDQDFLRIKSLTNDPTSEFSLNQGLVIKLIQESSPIIIPGDARQLRQMIPDELHTSPLGGYLGYHKLLELVCTRFWWLSLNSLVQEFCRQCILCLQTKVVTQKPLGLLQPLEPLLHSFNQVTMGIITHLPKSMRDDAVFTIVDRFSKYVSFVPYSTTSIALDLARLFYDHIVCKFGMPAMMVSDRDIRFLSNFWQSLMKMLQCKVAIFSGYHPQTDG